MTNKELQKLGRRELLQLLLDQAKEAEEDPGEWLGDLIEVMAYQELLKRRHEHRNVRKRLYY